MLELLDRELVVGDDVRAGFVNVLTIDENASRHDQRLRFRARVDEPALDEGDVEPLLLHSLTRVKPSWRK